MVVVYDHTVQEHHFFSSGTLMASTCDLLGTKMGETAHVMYTVEQARGGVVHTPGFTANGPSPPGAHLGHHGHSQGPTRGHHTHPLLPAIYVPPSTLDLRT